MNNKQKRRLAAATGAIVIVLIALLAVVGGNSSARTLSVAEAIELSGDSKIQVTGNVVENSFAINDQVLTFKIYDPEADPAATRPLDVRYDGGVSATFGNDVTAICTGKKNAEGVLSCSELVTKCPSKYENATDALTVAALLGYGDAVYDKPVKVVGDIAAGTLAGVDAQERFVLIDEQAGVELHVRFAGALPDGASEDSRVVLTGSLGADGAFTATDVALEA